MERGVNDAEKLARADRDIAGVENRVVQQLAIIEVLAAKGLDTVLAEKLLRLMRYDLEVMRTQRRLLLDGREHPVRPSRSRPGSRGHRPGQTAGLPRSGDRGEDVSRSDAVGAGPILTWESLPNRALIARTEDRLLVVRPSGGTRGAFRFAVLKPLPADGGLLHLAAGSARTTREAMLAAERVISPPPGATAPIPLPSPSVPGRDEENGHRASPSPETPRVRLDAGAGPGAVGTPAAF